MTESKVIEVLKDALELNVVEKEEKQEARRFAKMFGQNYLMNEKYDAEDAVEVINMVLTKFAKTSKRLVMFILEALQTMFPKINAKYQFSITS